MNRAVSSAMTLVMAASVALTACGGSASPSRGASRDQAAEQSAEVRLADYARCMREHGVDAELVTRAGGAHGVKFLPAAGGFRAAFAAGKACARYRPAGERVSVSPQQRVEQEEVSRRFAKCVRSHGIHLPEPKVLDTGGGNQEAYMAGVNPGSPAFQAAARDCGGPKG